MMIKQALIKEKSAELGIDICGVTDVKVLSKEKERLLLRKEKGRWPQPFTNRDIEELTNLSTHFENLESTIVVGMNYNNLQSANKFLSAYITKKDYHLFLAEKMELLIQELSKEIDKKLKKNINYKIFVDTAPFLERAVAVKAGIGFIGKNSMLINPNYGSTIFIGEILTDLKIEADSPLDMDCGECRECLANCEGGALKEDYYLDFKSCISYLTQKKGVLSYAERKLIGSHIWGCDKCQKVCPYNQSSSAANKKIIDPALEYFDKGLEYFLTIDRKNPPDEIKETALMWRGSRILLRNAVIAAVNTDRKKFFNIIKDKLSDNSPIIRLYAVWALFELKHKKAKVVLKDQLKIENNSRVKEEISFLLRREE